MHRYSGLVQRVEGLASERKQKILAIYAKAASLATARTGEDVTADPQSYLGPVGQAVVVARARGRGKTAPTILAPPGFLKGGRGKGGSSDEQRKSAPGAGVAAALAAAEALAAAAAAKGNSVAADPGQDKNGKKRKDKEKEKEREKEKEKEKEKTKGRKRKLDEKAERKERGRRKEKADKKVKRVKVKKAKRWKSNSDISEAADGPAQAGPDGSAEGKHYAGHFQHPSFGPRDIDLIVQLKSAAAGSWGQTTASWVIMGQVIDSVVTVTYEGKRVIFSDGTVMLDGTIDERDVVQGEVIMEGMRGGSFVLNPAEPPALETVIQGMKQGKKKRRRSRSSSSDSSSSSSAEAVVVPAPLPEATSGVATNYVGHFIHPSFGSQTVSAVVHVERVATVPGSPSTGSWVIMGQVVDSTVTITCDGSRAIFSDGTVVLEGTIQGPNGQVQGEVVIDGVRGGSFVLRPEEPSESRQEPAADGAPASPSGSPEPSPPSPVLQAQLAEAFDNGGLRHKSDQPPASSLEALHIASPANETREDAADCPVSPPRSPRSPSPQMAQPVDGEVSDDEDTPIPIFAAAPASSSGAQPWQGAASAVRWPAGPPLRTRGALLPVSPLPPSPSPSPPPPPDVAALPAARSPCAVSTARAGSAVFAAAPKKMPGPPAAPGGVAARLRRSRAGDKRPMAVKSRPMTRSKAAGPPAARSKANMVRRRPPQ